MEFVILSENSWVEPIYLKHTSEQMNRMNKAVEELFTQVVKMHFPGPLIVPLLLN